MGSILTRRSSYNKYMALCLIDLWKTFSVKDLPGMSSRVTMISGKHFSIAITSGSGANLSRRIGHPLLALLALAPVPLRMQHM